VYYDPFKPYVESVIGMFSSNRVAMSVPTSVQLVVVNVLSVNNVVIILQDTSFNVKLATLNAGGRASITFVAPASLSEGLQQARIAFANEDFAIFDLLYYRDTDANVVEVAPSVGPHLGGTKVIVTIASFPVVTVTKVLVTFGSASQAKFGTALRILSSTTSPTILEFSTPSAVGGKSVIVSVEPIGNPSKIVTFPFDYFFASTVLKSVSKYTATSAGGDRLTVIIHYLPVVLWSGEVAVRVGYGFVNDIFLTAADIILSYSNVELTQIIINVPALTPGLHKVSIYSAEQGPGSSVSFDIEVIDSNLPQVVEPLPNSACSSGGEMRKVFISKVLVGETASSFNVVAWDVAASNLVLERRSDGVSVLAFTLPISTSAGTRIITITYNDNLIAQISLSIQFCSDTEASVTSVTPSSVPSSGGMDVVLVIRNFVFDTKVPLSVSFGFKRADAAASPQIHL
jgi:hypothetical protein